MICNNIEQLVGLMDSRPDLEPKIRKLLEDPFLSYPVTVEEDVVLDHTPRSGRRTARRVRDYQYKIPERQNTLCYMGSAIPQEVFHVNLTIPRGRVSG